MPSEGGGPPGGEIWPAHTGTVVGACPQGGKEAPKRPHLKRDPPPNTNPPRRCFKPLVFESASRANKNWISFDVVHTTCVQYDGLAARSKTYLLNWLTGVCKNASPVIGSGVDGASTRSIKFAGSRWGQTTWPEGLGRKATLWERPLSIGWGEIYSHWHGGQLGLPPSQA